MVSDRLTVGLLCINVRVRITGERFGCGVGKVSHGYALR